MRRALVIAAALLASLAFAGTATAADSVYWVNEDSPISHAALDGSGGADLSITGPASSPIEGVAIDPATGQLYWSNWETGAIATAPLAGGAATPLKTLGATDDTPEGIAIDAGAGKIFWASISGGPGGKGAIAYANLDGSGAGGDLNVGKANLGEPWGLAIDPAAGRIYWSNDSSGGSIAYANLDGSGGGTLNTTGAPMHNPEGVAVDPANGRIYWANEGGSTIGFANLDGSGGGGTLDTAGATLHAPNGVAVDAVTGRVYWDNSNLAQGVISSAAADDSGAAADLVTTGATTSFELGLMALFKAPSATSAPAITGGSVIGSTLSCSAGAWAADAPGSQLYQSPQGYAYEWTKDGQAISGATGPTLLAGGAGSYACRVTATNAAGSTVATSAALALASPPPPPSPAPPSGTVRLAKVELNGRKGFATLLAQVSGPGTLTLTGHGIVGRHATVAGAGIAKLAVRVQGKAKRTLAARGRVKVKATVTFAPSAGAAVTTSRSLTLRRHPSRGHGGAAGQR